MPSELLPPFGQWAFGESRVQKNIRVIRVIRVQKTVSAPPRTKIRVIGEIRVQDKNIRVIRVIRVQKNIECDPCSKISCSKHLVRASKFIIGQFHIAASRNNSTFNIQKSKLRSAPPCANNIRVIRVITSLRSVGLRRISCSKEYTKGYALN
jgi:hypothetical protein